MTVFHLLVLGGLAAAAAFALGMVLTFRRPRPAWNPEEAEPPEIRAARREREGSLRAIKDLDFEHACGSVSLEEHERLREVYKHKAVAATVRLRALLDGRSPREAAAAKPTKSVVEELEAEIETLKKALR